jgi:Ca-activated chloride channel family protein
LRSVFAAPLVLFCFMAMSLHGQTPNVRPRQPTSTPKPPVQTEEVDPDDVVRIDTTLVNSPVLVIGRDGRFVPNLKRQDFQIFEDGVPQDVAFFAPVENPFTVALLIDTSRSTLLDLRDIQDAAISFVDKMRANDRALIVSFSGQIKVLAEPTSDRETLKRAIRSTRPEGNSRIYDAISFALADLNRISGRTAIIVFSDGVDNDSHEATFESTLVKIAQTQALIYPVQFSTYDNIQQGSNSRNRKAPEGSGFSQADYVRADAYLHQAAALSSTGVYPAQNISDLNYAIAAIADELHNEYSVGYYPVKPLQPDEKRRIEVRTKLPQLVVRARTIYARDPSGTLMRMSTTGNSIPKPKDVVGALPIRRNLDDPGPATEGRWICKGPDAPTDFAVVKEGFVSYCPKSTRSNDQTNAWFISKPRDTETLCKGFLIWRGRELPAAPIPTGFVVTSEAKSPVCSRSNDKNSNNAWLIRKPVGREIVCKGFPIPKGFVTAGETSVDGCPAKLGGKNAWMIDRRKTDY